MLAANLKIIEELKLFVDLVNQQPAVLEKLSTLPNSFTRNRKLPFERLVLLIAKLCKKTLSVEIEQFFEELTLPMTCSVSAFTQQRMKLESVFFELWNRLLVSCYYQYYGAQVKRWKGYRIIAADGSNISLVNTPALHACFGGQTNQCASFVQAKTFYCYDVLNELLLFPQIHPYRYGELPMAYDNIHQLESDMLMIYDRNFCNYKMVALHQWQEKEIKFVIRGNESQLFIQRFIASGASSEIVEMLPQTNAIKGMERSGYIVDKKTAVKVRLVRVNLEKSVEVVLTNLWEEEGYPSAEFKALYFKRWSIETNIALQKNILQLESFSGLTPLSVKQDFYATVFIANLHSILIKDAQAAVDNNTATRKHPAKINRNKSHGKLRSHLVELFTCHQPEEILKLLHGYFIRNPIPVRHGRTFARIVKNKQSKSKHKTYMNYKPAF